MASQRRLALALLVGGKKRRDLQSAWQPWRRFVREHQDGERRAQGRAARALQVAVLAAPASRRQTLATAFWGWKYVLRVLLASASARFAVGGRMTCAYCCSAAVRYAAKTGALSEQILDTQRHNALSKMVTAMHQYRLRAGWHAFQHRSHAFTCVRRIVSAWRRQQLNQGWWTWSCYVRNSMRSSLRSAEQVRSLRCSWACASIRV